MIHLFFPVAPIPPASESDNPSIESALQENKGSQTRPGNTRASLFPEAMGAHGPASRRRFGGKALPHRHMRWIVSPFPLFSGSYFHRIVYNSLLVAPIKVAMARCRVPLGLEVRDSRFGVGADGERT
jgi:hypothetical protein